MAARLLVHTRTTAYRHDSIPARVEAVRTIGDFEVDHTEDPAAIEEPLDGYAAVVFLSTSGELLTPAARRPDTPPRWYEDPDFRAHLLDGINWATNPDWKDGGQRRDRAEGNSSTKSSTAGRRLCR